MKITKFFSLLVCAICFGMAASGAQVDSTAAASAVKGWLQLERSPLGAKLGSHVKNVETFKDVSGAPLYHVVYLEPGGFVIVSAEDQTEPIIAFVDKGRFDSSEKNPLGALISRDLPNRVAHARKHANNSAGIKNHSKWQKLQSAAASAPGGAQPKSLASGSISDMRVSPFIATSWDQWTSDGTAGGLACYNYFTPPHEAGNINNSVCGCVATALAQVMYYYQWPSTGVGTPSFTISYNAFPMQWPWPLRGGDGNGGPYDWANMPLAPSGGATLDQCKAIGALTYDAGVAVHMAYTDTNSSAYLTDAKSALVTTFKYGNTILTEASTINTNYDLQDMINPNLDAHLPVIFGIDNSHGGHCIVCDGYGYSTQTLYHHLNMGWGGVDNAWYHFPLIDLTDTAPYYNFNACLYNIFTNGSGEIISGRVLDTNGVPVPGASVTATTPKGGFFATTTDPNGIYALVGLPSSTTCTITVTNAGYFPAGNNVTTKLSYDMGTDCGNVWGVNFTLFPAQGPPVFTIQPADQSATIGSGASFTAYATGQLPLSYQWQCQTPANPVWVDVSDDGTNSGSQTSTLTISPTDLSMSGKIFQCVATNSLGAATSAPPATLTVNGLIPTFALQPQNQIVLDGSNATFTALAIGTPPITYQWQYQPSGSLTWLNVNDDGTNSGSQTNTLTISPVDLTMNGKPLQCLAINSWGTGTSAPVMLGVSVDNSTSISLTNLAGLPLISGSANGTYTNALFNTPYGIAVDSHTNVFVADMHNNVIRELTPSGTGWNSSTIAGLPGSSGSADGISTNARFNAPYGITVDSGGNVFVADTYNHTIRKLTPSGTNWAVSTIAGLAGTSGVNDGSSSSARFNRPIGIAADSGGNHLYVADEVNSSIRQLTFNGTFWTASTIAGGSFGPDDGTNRNAKFGNPYGIAVNSAGKVFVTDKWFDTIRQISPIGTNWVVTTIAGSSGTTGSADGTNNFARFKYPTGIAAGADGNLYVADNGNNTVRRLAPAGINWTVFTIAGLAGSVGNVDGTGKDIRMNGPFGIAVDINTNVYVADSLNNTIRGPALSQSYPHFVHLSQGSKNALTFTWSAQVASTYLVQFKTNLNQAAWANLTTVTTSNWTGSASIPIGADAQRYYRVVPGP